MGTCQSTEGSVHLSPASKHEKSVVFAIHEPDSHESDKTSTTVKIPESEQPISTPAPDPLVTNGTAKTSPELPPKASGPVGGATAALEAAMASGGGAPAYPPPTPLPNPMMGGATAALTAAADERSDVSSIGSNGSGIGSVGGGGLSTSHRSNGNMHRSRLSLGNSSSVIGLDSMIESRREEGGLTANVVHMEVPFGKPIEEVYDGIQTGPVLGSGISGVVRLVTHKATGVKYAVKCLDLGLVDTEEGLMQLREEIFIMCQLDHPNIVRLEEVYESHSEIYLVQELCLGGELFDRLDEQPDYHYTEAECARLIKQMLCAVRYLHSKGIIHRDLKLENFLFSSSAPDSELKMIDFGLSKHFQYGEIQQQAVGTPYTVAPEVIRGQYDERCDIWAIGVIAFLLLSGDPPFGGCGGPEPLMVVRANILNGAFDFEPEEIWDIVSLKAKEFINALLVTNPKYRPTAMEAQNLAWLQEWAHLMKSDKDHTLNPNVVRALVNFKEFSDMRKLLCEVLSFTLLPEQIKDLRKEFETLDTDGSGEISLLSLKQVLVTNAGAGSLGALTEEEVEDIFNAMRVKKTETTIRWHEFIAAGLSQCEVDDRNLRLAFDRLDNDHKGYVTLDDIMDLMGSDAVQGEEALRKMWGDSMRDVNCSATRITYEDFVLIMKGQTRDFDDGAGVARSDSGQRLNGALLHAVNEVDEAEINMRTIAKASSNRKLNLDPLAATGMIPTPKGMQPLHGYSPHLAPDGSNLQVLESPLSMDDNDGMELSMQFQGLPNFTPPATPKRAAAEFGSHDSEDNKAKSVSNDLMANTITSNPESNNASFPVPEGKKPNVIHVRIKSRSFDERELKRSFNIDSRRAVALPEHDPEKKKLLLKETSMSALQVNRHLYRSHRQMRLSVIDACKRFEEQQAKHAHGVLLAKKNSVNTSGFAGLVMRRVENKTVSSEEVKNLLEKNRKEQQDLMEKANRRGGGRRSRRNRKKTVSDLSTMMGSLSSEEMTKLSMQASSADSGMKTMIPPVIETKPLEDVDDDTNFRRATVPGEFRKVKDPFGSHGKYAAIMS
mmetsp:Transcript_6974/g.14194  ORF Transcript_6974/g.14194 Transcript_6974/m.14194 type:complete len:1059 (+) Transcript_6974:270-3446(+)